MLRRLCLALCCLGWLIAGPLAARAQEGFTVAADRVAIEYGQKIDFHLEAAAPFEVRRVTLTYTLPGRSGDVINNVGPEWEPGRAISATYSLRTARSGLVQPFATIRYRYTLDGAAGEQVRTEEKSVVYRDDRFEWEVTEAGGIAVYAYGESRRNAPVALAAARRTLDRMAAEAGFRYDRPIRVLLYDNTSYLDEVRPFRSEATLDTAAGLALSDAGMIVMLGNTRQTAAITIHEVTHLITHALADSPRPSPFHDAIPPWLDEGLATYAEGDLSPGYRRRLEAALRQDRLLSVKRLEAFPSRPDEISLLYAEGYSLVRFLLDGYGPEKMAALLAAYQAGTTHDEALRQVYGFDRDGLDTAWRSQLPAQLAALRAAEAPAPAAAPSGGAGTLRVAAFGIAGATLALLVVAFGLIVWMRRRRPRRPAGEPIRDT